jgi:multiple sugar transport system permease protein
MNIPRLRKRAYRTGYHVLVLGACFLLLYPLLWLLFGSFKANTEILAIDKYRLLPQTFMLSNYVQGWKGFGNNSFGTFFWNSTVVTVLSTLGTVVSCAIVSFGFARVKFKGSQLWFALMLGTMLLPGEILIIPRYILFQKLKWINTYLPLVVPSWFAASAFFIFLNVQFIRTLPKELDESAIIDGCSLYGVFAYIILPLAKPALISTAVIASYWKWNDFLEPLLYLSRPKSFTVSLALRAFVDSSSQTDYGQLFAMSALSLVPIFLLFVFFNKYIVQGISTTGIKG